MRNGVETIGDRAREQHQLHEQGEDLLNVSIPHRRGCRREAYAGREDEAEQNPHGGEQKRERDRGACREQNSEHEREPDGSVERTGQEHRNRNHQAREVDLADELGIRHQRGRDPRKRLRCRVPPDGANEHEEEVGHAFPRRQLRHVAEDDRENARA